MNDLILINKPKGKTSHDIVDIVRRKLKIKKVGHGGTLDPLATGLLVLGIGKGTKKLGSISGLDKEYIAEFKLGITTDTQDTEGKIIKEVSDFKITMEDLKKVCLNFVGNIKQIPPMYSAKKFKGKKLYELARQGIEIKREPVELTIDSLEILEFDGVCGKMKVSCSSGTYIRTLCHDIGNQLGVGGIMTELVRTRIGEFKLENAITVGELK